MALMDYFAELFTARIAGSWLLRVVGQRDAGGFPATNSVMRVIIAYPSADGCTMSHIVLLNPRFEVTFLGLEHALPLLHKKATMPVSSLPLLAALTPADHKVTIIDENVEPIDFARLAGADLVGLTGMIVQRKRMREILTAVKKLNVFTVVGGPWVTVQEDYFGNLPDAVFIGEAEETWPRFLEEWKQGKPRRRYQQAGLSDMTHVPPPRLNLLKTRKYLFGGVQFSRGCLSRLLCAAAAAFARAMIESAACIAASRRASAVGTRNSRR